jgi:hypothetical protein
MCIVSPWHCSGGRAMEASTVRKATREQSEATAPPTSGPTSRNIKLQQCAKIAELRQALVLAGFYSLDRQALALGLGRSTTWIVLKAGHKSTGLTGSIVRRILGSPELPLNARQIIEQYVAHKLAGAYGHDKKQLRKFRDALHDDRSAGSQKELSGSKLSTPLGPGPS